MSSLDEKNVAVGEPKKTEFQASGGFSILALTVPNTTDGELYVGTHHPRVLTLVFLLRNRILYPKVTGL